VATIVPGQILKVTGATRERLGDILAAQLDDYETTYSDYFADIAVWWDWHNAVPLHKEKNFPFKGASNLVVPLIKLHAKGMVSSLLAKVFGPNGRIIFGRTENEDEDGERKAKDLARFWNWAARGNDFDFKTPIIVDLTFVDDEDNKILVKKRIFFSTVGYDVSVIATNEGDLRLLSDWAARIRPAASPSE